MIRFHLFGIPVTIQPFFWITMTIIGAMNTGGGTGRDSTILVALFVLAGSLSILVHELGHALAIRFFGLPTAITLHSFGGFAIHPAGILTRPQNFLVTAAGPGIQFLLGVAAFLALRLLDPVTANPHLHHFLGFLVLVSWFWAAINLVPVLPLDGGRLLDAILGPARIRVTLWISIVSALAIAALMFTQSRGFILPVFLCFMAWESWKSLKTLSPR